MESAGTAVAEKQTADFLKPAVFSTHMANLEADLAESPPSGQQKGGDDNSVQPPLDDEKDGVSHGDDDARRKEARHASSGDESSRSSSMSGLLVDHAHDLRNDQPFDLRNSATKEVLVDAKSAMGQSFGEADTCPQSNTDVNSPGTIFIEGMHSQNAFGASSCVMSEGRDEGIQEAVMDSAENRSPGKKVSEDISVFDARATDGRRFEHSPQTSWQTEAQFHSGLPVELSYEGHADIYERLPKHHAASQNCDSYVTSDMGRMQEATSPCEASSTNGFSQGFPQQEAFLDPPAAQPPAMDHKEESAQFTGQDTLRYGGKPESLIRFENTHGATTAVAHKKESPPYSQSREDDFKINLEQMMENKQAQNLSKKITSVFSRSSQYASRSSHPKSTVIVLRSGSAIFSLIVFSIIISTSEKRIAAGSTFFVKFSDYKAYNFLAAINLLTFLYSSGQLFLLAKGKPTSRILSSRIKWGTSLYLCDQVLAVLMISSSSSAATAAELSWHGLHNIWPPACSTWRLSLFCSRADVAIGMSFISCLLLFLSTLSSGYLLSNLLAD